MKNLLIVVCLLGNLSSNAQDTLASPKPLLFGGKEINIIDKRPLIMIDGGFGLGVIEVGQRNSDVSVLRLNAAFSVQKKIAGLRIEATASIGHSTNLLNFQLGPTIGYTNQRFGVLLNPYVGMSKSEYYKKTVGNGYSHQGTGFTIGGQLVWDFRLLPNKRIRIGGTIGAGWHAFNLGMNTVYANIYYNGNPVGVDNLPGFPKQVHLSIFTAFPLAKK